MAEAIGDLPGAQNALEEPLAEFLVRRLDAGNFDEVDAEAESAIRLYALMRGYQRLQQDRALFQQWLAIPGNKDISPTQLDGMANTYMADWHRHRNQMRRIRR